MRVPFTKALAMFAMAVFVACTGDGPTAPDPSVGMPAETQSQPSTVVPVVPPSPDPACAIHDIVATPLNFTPGGQLPEVVKVKVANPRNTTCANIHLSSWNSDDGANQVWFADSDGKFPPVEVLSVKVPCEVWVQIDVNNSPYLPQRGQYSPGYFVVAFWGRGPSCTPPSPPPPPNPTCESYPRPTITGDIFMDLQVTLAMFDRGTVLPDGGSFNPTLPASMHRPAPGQPPASFSTVYTLPYGPEPLHCSVSKTFTKSVPPRTESCDNYPPPTITGDIDTDTQPTQVTFSRGSVAPSGGDFNPTLPQTFPRPAPGQPAGSFSTVYTLPYGPEPLHCSVSRTFTKPVPPREPPACQPIHLNQADGCYKPNPWGNGNNPDVICGYFNLVPTFKDESGSGDLYQFVQSTRMVVVHWGGASCAVNGAQSYSFTEDAVAGGTVTNPAGNPGQGGFSFGQYCGCPAS